MSSEVILCTLATVAVACAFDLTSARIPNWLTFGAAAVGLTFHLAAPQGDGGITALFGLIAGLAIFFPLFALRAMGAGDVKLLAALGAWVGASTVAWVAIYTSIIGGVLALGFMFSRGYLRQGLSNVRTLLVSWAIAGIRPVPAVSLDSPTALRMPYALPIALGLLVTLWQR